MQLQPKYADSKTEIYHKWIENNNITTAELKEVCGQIDYEKWLSEIIFLWEIHQQKWYNNRIDLYITLFNIY